MDELTNDVKPDAKDFAKEVASKSGVDLEKEEFIGVENILKVDDLERELEEKDKVLEEERLAYKKETDTKTAIIKEQEKKLKDQQEKILKLEEENRTLKHSKKK